MAKNKVEITGLKTSELKTIKSEEMNELFLRYSKGDKLAKELLVKYNLKLVLSILKHYQNKSDNMDDLFQVGVVGLIKAIDNFDLKYGVKFSTYAVLMIEGEIKRFIRDNNQVRISRGIKELAYRIISYKEDYFKNNGFYPNNKTICSELSISEYELGSSLLSLKEPMSVFEPIYNDGGDTIFLLDQIEDVKENRNIHELIALRKALNKIKTREKEVLLKRYIIGESQSEIAAYYGISQAQVSRIESSAINNVKRLIM